jgi:hypothetical protein
MKKPKQQMKKGSLLIMVEGVAGLCCISYTIFSTPKIRILSLPEKLRKYRLSLFLEGRPVIIPGRVS